MKPMIFLIIFAMSVTGCGSSAKLGIEQDWKIMVQPRDSDDPAERISKHVLADAFNEFKDTGLVEEIDKVLNIDSDYILAIAISVPSGFTYGEFELSADKIIEESTRNGYGVSATFIAWDSENIHLIANSQSPLAHIDTGSLAFWPPYIDGPSRSCYRFIMPLDTLVKESESRSWYGFNPDTDWVLEQDDNKFGGMYWHKTPILCLLIRRNNELGWTISNVLLDNTISTQYFECHTRIASVVETMFFIDADMIQKNERYQAMKMFTPEELLQDMEDSLKKQ